MVRLLCFCFHLGISFFLVTFICASLLRLPWCPSFLTDDASSVFHRHMLLHIIRQHMITPVCSIFVALCLPFVDHDDFLADGKSSVFYLTLHSPRSVVGIMIHRSFPLIAIIIIPVFWTFLFWLFLFNQKFNSQKRPCLPSEDELHHKDLQSLTLAKKLQTRCFDTIINLNWNNIIMNQQRCSSSSSYLSNYCKKWGTASLTKDHLTFWL